MIQPVKEKIILGIDPGTTIMGYGVLRVRGTKPEMIAMGIIDLRKFANHYLKLRHIHERVLSIIESYLPDELAIEAPFFGKNVQSMLKLGRAQGVAMAVALSRDIPITEYAPLKIKMAITGNGQASKEQVADMLQRMLRFSKDDMPTFMDATDGLAAAYCHFLQMANQSKESKEAMMFLKQKMDAAQGFIDAVRQRQNTLMTTMQAIIDLQRPFFLEGDESLLKPMILKDVAERTGLDISTISRVSNSKYVQTNYGIYPLKFFFSDGYTTEDGEEMSVREIRKILKECIDGEDKKKPLTDDELADILKEKGYPIARRTVAKYRQQLNIPVARLRK